MMMIPLIAAMAVLAGAPAPSSPPSISMEFDGTLNDGLKQLAQKSGLNLVVIGQFDERVNLNFPGVDGEQALETIATAYGLEVTRGGKPGTSPKMWVIRRANALVPGVPLNPEVARGVAEQARNAAEAARTQADVMQAKADAMREPNTVNQNAVNQGGSREQALEAAEAAREEAQTLREKADELREAVQEAKETAREQAQDAAEAERERLEAVREQGLAQADLSRAQADLERHRVSTGGPVTVEKGSRIDTAVAYGGPVIVEEDAVVDGDAVAFGGDVILKKGAIVEGDAVSFGGTVVRGEGSSVHGESVSMGGSGFGSTVARNVIKSQRTQRATEAQEAAEPSSGRGVTLAKFLLEFAALFGLGFMMMMFAPQRMKALEATIRDEPGKNGLTGVLGLLGATVLATVLCVIIVGIPLVMVAVPTATALVVVGLAAVANAVGARLPTGKLRKTQALVLAVGSLAMVLVFQVPVLGWMFFFLAAFVSLGAIIRTRFGQSGARGMPMLDPMQSAPVL